jgi:serine/threonine-protein kinase HipA
MHSAAGLLHSDFRVTSLVYEDLVSFTSALTKDIREVENMFRLAVVNVLAHNRDDHAKNFCFLMDLTGGCKLSPAYDLTFSGGPGGEQSTMVLGEGKIPE